MRNRYCWFLAVPLLALLGCAPQPRQPLDVSGVNHEGLQRVEARNYEVAFVRPGVDFTRYDKLLVDEMELAFRTPDRSRNQFPLTEDQKEQFQALLEAAFADESGKLENLELTDEPGPTVMDISIRVQDVQAALPGRGVGQIGRAAIALVAAGEATLVIELRDSQSEEVLVRVFDQRAVEGAAILRDGQPISTWEDVEALCREWASTARRGLDVLVTTTL